MRAVTPSIWFAERLLALPVRGELAAERVDLLVDRLLLALDVVAERGRRHRADGERAENDAHRHAAKPPHEGHFLRHSG